MGRKRGGAVGLGRKRWGKGGGKGGGSGGWRDRAKGKAKEGDGETGRIGVRG